MLYQLAAGLHQPLLQAMPARSSEEGQIPRRERSLVPLLQHLEPNVSVPSASPGDRQKLHQF
jgi:hypothetical protein